jgi:UDP-N-acetylmuramoylalanine-D-glutamate ligase
VSSYIYRRKHTHICHNFNVTIAYWLQQDPLFEKHSGLRTILGNFDRQLFKDVDMVVVSPGVPLENYGLSSLLEAVSQIL